MALHHAPWDHRLFVLVAVATHAMLGYALGALLDRPGWGAFGGVLPDADLLFPAAWQVPFAHRGVTHSPLFVAVATAGVAAALRSRRAGAAIGVAGFTHVAVDSLTAAGVPLLYPVDPTRYGVALDVHGAPGTVALLAVAAALLAVARLDRAGT